MPEDILEIPVLAPMPRTTKPDRLSSSATAFVGSNQQSGRSMLDSTREPVEPSSEPVEPSPEPMEPSPEPMEPSPEPKPYPKSELPPKNPSAIPDSSDAAKEPKASLSQDSLYYNYNARGIRAIG